jgi:hypothetical protein
MAAVFVAEPFAGMHSVDQPAPPSPAVSSQQALQTPLAAP